MNKKKIPNFKNEDEERDFWSKHSPLEYFNKNNFRKVSFPNLKPSTKTISIRLPEYMLEDIFLLMIDKEYHFY